MFYGTYIGNNRMLIKTAWGMRLIAACEDMSLMPTLMVDGVIELGFTNWLLQKAEKGEFSGKNIIDVGANIGYFTVLFSCIVGQGGKVTAYEANPKVRELLKENIYLSQLQNIAEAYRYAVSDSHMEVVKFNVSTKYQGNSSLMDHGDGYKEQFATDGFKEIEAISVTLSQMTTHEKIELLKIDVEGAEYKVLHGAEELLKSGRVKYVMFELNKNMLGEDVGKLFELLSEFKQNGALFYRINSDGTEAHANLDDIWQSDYIDNILMKL